MLKLFTTSFLQVFLVSANTYFIARKNYLGVAIAGFLISYLWTINIRKVNIATKKERLIYSSGACLGGLCGLMVASRVM